jgi:hypothetical protein
MNLIEQLLKQFAEKSGQNKPLLPGQPAGGTPPFVPPMREPVPPMQNAATPAPPPQQAPTSSGWAGDFAGEKLSQQPQAALKEVTPQGRQHLHEVQPNVTGKHLQDIQTPDRGDPKQKWFKTPFHKDNDRMAMMFSALSDGFGGMTMSGKSGMAAMNKANYAKGMEGVKNNKTMRYLVDNNPELARKLMDIAPEHRGEFMQLAMKKDFGLDKEFRTNTSGVQIDEATGQQFVVVSDGYGSSKVQYLTGKDGNPITGETAQSEADLKVRLNGINLAAEKGSKFFDQGESIRRDVRLMDEARGALADGAQSGVFRQYLPAFDEATQRLRNAANNAGINIINSATFGALSEKEMQLAMSTGIPQGLSEQELDKYLEAKIIAQEKLYAEVDQRARDLNSGSKTLGEWQETWKSQDEGRQYDDAYADGYSGLTYDRRRKKKEEDKDDEDAWGGTMIRRGPQ